VEFPERVTALLGNHELNLLIDRTRQPGDRYLDYAYAAAHPAQYSSWLSGAIGGSPSEAEQRTLSALYAALQEVYAQGLQAKVRMAPDHPHSIVHFVAADAQRETTEHLKRWQAAYLAGVAPSTPLGAWLQQRPVTAVLGDTLFVHGGVPPALLDEHHISSAAGLAYLHEAWHNATWAAASTGEEPYSIAMTVADTLGPKASQVSILATDVDTEVLKVAAAGVYPDERVEKMAPDLLRRHFLRGKGDQAGNVRVRPELCQMVDFAQLNLLAPEWPMRGQFDAIFCRNVLIYFNQDTKASIIKRLHSQLVDLDACLMLGSSESILFDKTFRAIQLDRVTYYHKDKL
jgi:hypothetical protein